MTARGNGWLLRLPEDLEREFTRELLAFEEETKMPYITSVERIGRQEGRQEGLNSERQLLLRLARRRFGDMVVEESRALLERITEPEVLEELGETLLDRVDSGSGCGATGAVAGADSGGEQPG